MAERQHIFAKFLEEAIFLEKGRLLFSLFHAFVSNGYQISFFNRQPAGNLMKYGQLAVALAGVTQVEEVPMDTREHIYVFDKEDPILAARPWLKKVKIGFDIFSPYWFERPIIMPFPIHPVHAMRNFENRLAYLRSINKNKRIFFSGDTKNYRLNRVRYPKPKLTRLEVLGVIQECMGDDVLIVDDISMLGQLNQSSYTNKCVLVDTNRIWVDDKIWPDMLAAADFFLAPPGIIMPMCHNIIEAMAVGCVPITNYPEWFDPALESMNNCIAFDDKDDLLDKLRFALSLKHEHISEMRANALNYYERYLSPASFVQRIEEASRNQVTVLMIAERNMVRNSAKLGQYSVLIQGVANQENDTGIRRALSVLLG